MSETTTETSTAITDGKQAETTSTATKFAPITSQEDLDRVVGDRVKRERAKFADYDELKAKAGQLDSLAEASQTETEKATTRAKKAETERDSARAEALRLRIAVEHGISIEDADLFLTGTDEESLRAQAKRLSDREADRTKHGNLARREGQTITRPAEDSLAGFAGQLFGD
jgi:hypothetical protein